VVVNAEGRRCLLLAGRNLYRAASLPPQRVRGV